MTTREELEALADYVSSSLGLRAEASIAGPRGVHGTITFLSPQPTPGEEYVALLRVALTHEMHMANDYRWRVRLPSIQTMPLSTYSTIQQYINVWYDSIADGNTP